MRVRSSIFALVICCAALSSSCQQARTAQLGTQGRRVLYYRDPMHPSYRSDRPGIAPDCNMALTPVYADEAGGGPAVVRVDERQALGIKITGPTTDGIQKLGERIQAVLKEDSATRSVFAERTGGGYYLDIDWDRDELGRRGIAMETAQAAVRNAIGGETVTEVIDGRARYPVNVRYLRDFRSDIDALNEVLVATPGGRQMRLSQLAAVHAHKGPSMIRDENGLLTGYVYIDPGDADIRDYQQRTTAILGSRIQIPEGYSIGWSGQYEALERVRARLLAIVPLTLALIALLIRINTRSWVKTGIVMLAVPFSTIGASWALYLLGYHMSTAVWVGIIALMGVDAQTGVFMLLYLDLAYEEALSEGRLHNSADLKKAVLEGAAKRIRPKFMTVATMTIGLLPILWSTATGADLMKRIAAPMVGGLASSFLMELVAYPVLYMIWRQRTVETLADSRPRCDAFAPGWAPDEL